MHEIRIGVEVEDFLTLKLHGRQFPDASDYWYANRLTCDVEIAVGAFRGAFGAVIRNEDVGRFLGQFRTLHERSSGRATLEAPAGWLCLDVIGEGRSRLGVEGQLCDNCNTLEFRMALDEADLPAMIRRLDEICETYPVIGHAEPQGGEEAAP